MQGKWKKIEIYYKILTKYGQTPLFITFEQSFFSLSTLHKVICYKFFQAGSGSVSFKLLDPDSDPNREEQLDPDPQKINADPQPCFVLKLKFPAISSFMWRQSNWGISTLFTVHQGVPLRQEAAGDPVCPPVLQRHHAHHQPGEGRCVCGLHCISYSYLLCLLFWKSPLSSIFVFLQFSWRS